MIEIKELKDRYFSTMELWSTECEIDEQVLDTEILKSARLHQKYLQEFFEVRDTHAFLARGRWVLLKELRDYYLGRSELCSPVKILKNEVEFYIKADKKMQRFNEMYDLSESFMKLLEEILSEIRNRQWRIKTAIEFRKFQAGG